jgi:acyl-CoA dehydrogenase
MNDPHRELRESIERLCARFDAEYWRGLDERHEFPEAFVAAFVEGGWLGAAMPTELGGSGLGLTEAVVIMQTVAQSGAALSGASSVHLNIFGPMPVVRYGSEALRNEAIPRLISGEDRMCFGVTEPNSGLDTSSLETKAERKGNGWMINGRKLCASCGPQAPSGPTRS